jgi:hypothetical protein
MKHAILTLLLILILTLLRNESYGQIDTIKLSTQDLITSNLKPGVHQYLVYFGNTKKKKVTASSIWNREVTFKQLNGEDVIEVEQQWYSSDTTFNRYVYSISRKRDFKPIYHTTKGKNGIEAFNFSDNEVTGADSVEGNLKKDMKVDASPSTLNWELDMEVFSTLPFKKEGQRFIINFYHPGGRTAPKDYEYAVVGSEKIKLADGKETDCWKLKIEYAPTSSAIFWIGKKSREVLKMQEVFGAGYRYKVKFSTPVDLTGI